MSNGDFEFYPLSNDALRYLEKTTAKAVARISEAPRGQQVPVRDPGPADPNDDRVADAPE